MTTQTKDSQSSLTPQKALEILVGGNERFVGNSAEKRDLLAQVKATASGQFPFAVVLSCIDSRVPAEVIFDQGIGDIFSARVAGNVVNDDTLGSMEFACKLAGSMLIVVMGHTSCGAVIGACAKAELGHLTGLLAKITPVVEAVQKAGDVPEAELAGKVAVANVDHVVGQIREQSAPDQLVHL